MDIDGSTVEICIPKDKFLNCKTYNGEDHICEECNEDHAYVFSDIDVCPPVDEKKYCDEFRTEVYTLAD